MGAFALLGLLLPLQRAWWPGSGATAWLLDLASHWQHAYALMWLAACALGAMRCRIWWLGLPVALLPLATASRMPSTAAGRADLSVVVANVHDENRDPRALRNWLEQSPADIVVISELTPEFADAMSASGNIGFPFAALHPSRSPPGIGVLSDRPLHNVRVIPDSLGALRMEMDITVRNIDVRLIAIHPKPPNAVRKHQARDRLMRELATSAKDQPTIVAGDVNATPWSSALLGAHSGRLARVTGAAPTYPTDLRGVFGVAIDHVLVSPHFLRVDAARGPEIGSDHYPVRASVRIRE